MELEQALKERRSTRKYLDKEVDKSLIEKMIGAAILAPSWKNSQTARYHVVMSKEVLETIKKDCLPKFNSKSVEDAPVLIITSFVKNSSGYEKNGEETNELGNGWGFYDLGLHNENLLLKAKDLGLDTLVIGIRDAKKIREILLIEENEIIVSVIGLGYSESQSNMPKRKETSEITKFY